MTTTPIRTESLSSTNDTTEISTSASSGFDSNTTQEQEWQSNESNDRQSAEKVVSTVASLVHQYNRDGTENSPKDDYRNRYSLDFPERYQNKNEVFHRDKNQNYPSQQFQQQYQQQQYQQPYLQQQYQQQQYQQPYPHQQNQQQYVQRTRDEKYPVTIQGCGHTMRDVSGPYVGTQFPDQGILQSWLAGSGWRGNYADDDKHPSQPLQVTTATPKTVASYRNRDYTRYDFNYQDKGGGGGGDPYKPRYDPEAGIPAARENNLQVPDFDRTAPTWMQPYSHLHQQRLNRNNRIVYYEYNLEDRLPGSSRCHPMDRNCGPSNKQYDNRWYGGDSNPQRHHFNNGHGFQPSDEYYYQNQQPYHSRPEGSRTVDSRDQPQIYNYLDEDSYRYRNNRRGDESQQNAGIGFVYSIDLPVDRTISPSTAFAYDVRSTRKNQSYIRRHAPVPHPVT